MNGQNVQIPGGADALSAIDTGTTLIGGPTDGVQAIYNAIPDSQALTGQMEGFFAYRKFPQPGFVLDKMLTLGA